MYNIYNIRASDVDGLEGSCAVILAGGAGTRFWPLSTERQPKQFLRIIGDRSLLQQSYDRLLGLIPAERILVLTSDRFAQDVRQDLPDLPVENIVGEPLRRDTAAAVTLAALYARARFGAQRMAIVTADHFIEPVDRFQETMRSAFSGVAASPEALHTIGIQPTHASTGFGYLWLGECVAASEAHSPPERAHRRVLAFREKPTRETAETYLASGHYHWNSGMFIWATETILDLIAEHLPDHLNAIEKAVTIALSESAAAFSASLTGALKEAFLSLPKISIDYGVMEHAPCVHCVPATFQWDDVGGWPALASYLPEDSSQNATQSTLFAQESAGNIVFSEDPSETVALLGVEDLVVVRVGKTTLVMKKDRSEAIKALVQALPESLR